MIEQNEHGEIREISINRPPVNAIDHPMLIAMREALSTAIDDGVGGIVLSGRPGVFSAGLDIPSIIDLERDELLAYWNDFYALFKLIAQSPVPVGAAITGHSPAGGTVLAIFCDWRVAARGRFFLGLNEVQVGLELPAILYHAYKRLIGARNAEGLGVVGAMLGPDEALDCGLVDEVVEPDQVVARGIERMTHMLAQPRAAMLATRSIARQEVADLFSRYGVETMEGMVRFWYRDETQATLRQFVESLKSRAAGKSV